MMKAFHLTLVAIALLLPVSMASAQDGPPPRGDGPPQQAPRPPAYDGELMQEFGVLEQVLGNQSQLGLTLQQQAKINDLMNNQSKAFNELRWPQQAEQEKLTLLLKSDSPDESSATEQFGKMIAVENQIKLSKLKLLIQVKNVLTAEQKAKLKDLKPRNQQGPPAGGGADGRRGPGPGAPLPGMDRGGLGVPPNQGPPNQGPPNQAGPGNRGARDGRGGEMQGGSPPIL